jgi:hypothetical protein
MLFVSPPAVESMSPSLEFLKLGSYDTLYSHYPAVIAHVLRQFMVGLIYICAFG